jgi:hypothetical protein
LCELEKKLIRFQNFNPLFSRYKVIYKSKFCKDGKIRKTKLREEFNENHINFNEYNDDKFLIDHLTYVYTHHYRTDISHYNVVNDENNDIINDDVDDYDDDDDDDDDADIVDNIINENVYFYNDDNDDDDDDDDNDDDGDI